MALTALAFVAADDDVFPRFLALSGVELENVRERASDPELLAAIIEFLMSDDALCGQFLAAENLDARTLNAALHALTSVA